MAKTQSKARYPERVSVQMSPELKEGLDELARRDYGGDRQALMREALQARVDGDRVRSDQLAEILGAVDHLRQHVAGKDQVAEVLQSLELLGQDAKARDLELQGGVNRLVEYGGDLTGMVSAQLTTIIWMEENFPNLAKDLANQTRDITELVAKVAAQTGEIRRLTEQGANQNDGIAELIARIANDGGVSSDERRSGLGALFSRLRPPG